MIQPAGGKAPAGGRLTMSSGRQRKQDGEERRHRQYRHPPDHTNARMKTCFSHAPGSFMHQVPGGSHQGHFHVG